MKEIEEKDEVFNYLELSYDTEKDSKYVAPLFKDPSNRSKPYENYGDDGRNDYPEKLLYYKNNCSWHQAILNYKIRQISGKGFIVEDDNEATKDFLENINDEENSSELLNKIATDLEIFGGYSLLITWDESWTKIESIKHIGFNRVRCGTVNDEGEIDTYYYKYDWEVDYGKIREFPKFDIKNAKKTAKAKVIANSEYDTNEINQIKSKPTTQLFYYIPYNPSSLYYTLPTYSGCISSIESDISSDLYNLTYFENGLAPTVGIGTIGNHSPAQWAKEVKTFNTNYLGAKNAGLPVQVHAKTREELPEIFEIKGAGKDERFNDLTDISRQKILTNHGISSPLLVGIALSGTLGNRDELEVVYNKFYSDVVLPEQFKILNAFNRFMKINGLSTLTIDKINIMDEEENTEVKDKNEEISKVDDEEIIDIYDEEKVKDTDEEEITKEDEEKEDEEKEDEEKEDEEKEDEEKKKMKRIG